MSKERAIRRAARQAEEQAAREARARLVARRTKRKALVRKLTPRLPDRRVGKMFPRRTRAQRTAITTITLIVLGAIWLLFDDTATRVALSAAILLALPAIIVVALGRR
jgi:hypothetical protein